MVAYRGLNLHVLVGHGAWKASEPLSDLDQLLSIVKHDPNVNAKQVVSVCNTQQRLVHPLSHTSHTRSPRRDAPTLSNFNSTFPTVGM